MDLPLSEKYRPSDLGDIVGNKYVVEALSSFLKNNDLPHLLFFGPPGTGKTTAAKALGRQLFQRHYEHNVLELNASDERGIDVVRDRIKQFAHAHSLFSGGKLVILDEADSMTQDAQNALRRIIEDHSKNVRFCIICNYPTKIIAPIKSRCASLRFGPVRTEEVRARLQYVCDSENIQISSDALLVLADMAAGDMRKSLNVLEALSFSGEQIDSRKVTEHSNSASDAEIKELYDLLCTGSFLAIADTLKRIREECTTSLLCIIQKVTALLRTNPSDMRFRVLRPLSDVEHRLAKGASEEIQAAALVSAFVLARSSKN